HFVASHAPNFLLATAFFLGRARRETLLCHSSPSNWVRRYSKRAISLRVCANMRLFFTSPRCRCKRRLNNFRRSSLSSRNASPALYSAICFRRSLSFDTFRLPSCTTAGRNSQFMPCQSHGLFRDLLG